jgi:hypothetical protein
VVDQEVTIPCPLSGGEHTYVIRYETVDVFGVRPRAAREVERRIICPCPVKSDTFSATIALTEPPGQEIRGVKVIGVKPDTLANNSQRGTPQ